MNRLIRAFFIPLLLALGTAWGCAKDMEPQPIDCPVAGASQGGAPNSDASFAGEAGAVIVGAGGVIDTAGAPNSAGQAGMIELAGAAGEAGSGFQSPTNVLWDVAGQSNAEGYGSVYSVAESGPWVPNPLVSYYVDGIATPFGPALSGVDTGKHGPELTIGNGSATQWGQPVLLNKSAVGAQTCLSLSTTWWPQHATGLAALRDNGNTLDEAWVQGESDALLGPDSATLQSDYTDCLKLYIGQVRAAFGSRVRFHILLINPALATWSGSGIKAIRRAQEAFPSIDSDADLVNVDDIVPAAIPHYNSLQEQEIGRRFVAARLAAIATH